MKRNSKLKSNIVSAPILATVTIGFVASLIFIVWQNFIYQPPFVGPNVVYTNNTDQVSRSTTRFLTFDNWDVRIPLKDTSYFYRPGDYKTIDVDDQIYVVSTRSLRVACGSDTANIGSVERVLANSSSSSKVGNSNVKGTKTLGKYLYIFSASTTQCADSMEIQRLQRNATQEFIPLLQTIEDLK